MNGIDIMESTTATYPSSVRLTVEDLEALAAEASRQSLSLACLIGAMTDASPIAWCCKEKESDGKT